MKKKLGFFISLILMILVMAISAFSATAYTVRGTQNYLALRTQPRTVQNNEIGRLYNGDTFYAIEFTNNNFAYGYNARGQYGYVNAAYLSGGSSYQTQTQQTSTVNYTVSGVNNYLGLRSTPTRNDRDEIGRLYNGQTFRVIQFRNDGYAYGIAPSGQYGYVVSSYLTLGGGSSSGYQRQAQPQQTYTTNRTVSGVNNYLGLRSTPTRNDRDEIGRLYNGQTFRVIEFRNDGFAYGIAPSGQYGYVVSAYLR